MGRSNCDNLVCTQPYLQPKQYSSDLADVYAEFRSDSEHCSVQNYARDVCNLEAAEEFKKGKESASAAYLRCIL